jgi:anti-anti-sigma factor
MKATFRKHVLLSPTAQKEILVVCLSGSIDVESVDLFRQACLGPLDGRPVLFNFEALSFVGSTGLRPFLESLNDLTKTAGSDVRFCEVRNDFRQILLATPLGRRPCLSNETSGVESYRIEFVPVAKVSATIDFTEGATVPAVQDEDLSAEG